MWKWLLISLVALPFDAVADSLYGAFMDGNQLYSNCTSSEKGPQNGCVGYVAGVDDAQSTVNYLQKKCFMYSLPDGVSPQQLVDITVKYLKDKPETRNQAAAGLVMLALSDVYPCPK